jgi:CRISPR-associated RAMP protein (TIGR02581 family)
MKILECTLVLESPVHVGTGRSEKGIDNPTLKVPLWKEGKWQEIPIIPASTLKGVIRSAFEKLACERGEHVCNIFNSICEKKEKREEMCIACKVFGNQKVASRVRFTDAVPVSPVQTFERAGVALARESCAVMAGPFVVEAIPPGVEMKFKIVIDLEEGSKELQLLKEVLEKASRGELQFGGKKSTGMGWCRLESRDL